MNSRKKRRNNCSGMPRLTAGVVLGKLIISKSYCTEQKNAIGFSKIINSLPSLPPRTWSSGLPFSPAAILESLNLMREVSCFRICYGVLLLQNEGQSQAAEVLCHLATCPLVPLTGVPLHVFPGLWVQSYPLSALCWPAWHFLP